MTIETIEPELLAPAHAADVLNVSPDRVRQLVREGVLKAVPISDGRRVFRYEDVAQLAKHRQQAR